VEKVYEDDIFGDSGFGLDSLENFGTDIGDPRDMAADLENPAPSIPAGTTGRPGQNADINSAALAHLFQGPNAVSQNKKKKKKKKQKKRGKKQQKMEEEDEEEKETDESEEEVENLEAVALNPAEIQAGFSGIYFSPKPTPPHPVSRDASVIKSQVLTSYCVALMTSANVTPKNISLGGGRRISADIIWGRGGYVNKKEEERERET
jgi:hypothetical protein